jgi:hypothetical protein
MEDPMPRRNEAHATRRHFAVRTTAVVAIGLLALTACDASRKSANMTMAQASTSGGADSGAGYAVNAPALGAPNSAPAFASPSAASSAKASVGSSGSGPQVLANRDVIYTADITVRAESIKNAVSKVENLVGAQGGVVYGEQVDLTPKDPDNPGDASATVILKVPPSALAATLDAISHVGTEVSRTENSDDVTSKVVDVNARISAAQASIARLTDLLSHTGNVSDLLNVENELSQRDADLESLEQQQKALSAQTSQATITVHLLATPPVAKTVQAKQAHVFGFLRGLHGGWHAFTATMAAIATAIGALLPFIGVLALIALAGFFGRRRFARSHNSNEPATPSEGI